MDGTYKVTLRTPMGTYNGMLTLRVNGQALSGKVEAMNNELEFTGQADGDNFSFSIAFDIGWDKVKADVTGQVAGDTLTARANTSYGIIPMEGVRA